MKPLCDLCGTRHESYQAHVFASNAASNKVTASNDGNVLCRVENNDTAAAVAGDFDSGKKNGQRGPGRSGGSKDLALSKQGDLPHPAGEGGGDRFLEKKQRWPREAYNAYQREYMRKRRRGL